MDNSGAASSTSSMLVNAKIEPTAAAVGSFMSESHEDRMMIDPANAAGNTDELFLHTLIHLEPQCIEWLQCELEKNGVIKQLLSYNYSRGSEGVKRDERSNELRHLMLSVINTECMTLIQWARKLPGFSSLSLEERTCCLEHNYLECVLIEFMWRSTKLNNGGGDNGMELFLHPNLPLSRQVFIDELGLSGDIFDYLTSVLRKLMLMNLTKEEYLCLKALNLFKSNYRLADNSVVNLFRQKCMSNLRRVSAADPFRCDSLIMLLSDIKSISISLMHALIQFNVNHKITLPTLLKDMLNQTQSAYGLLMTTNLMISSSSFETVSNGSTRMDSENNTIEEDEDELDEDDDEDESEMTNSSSATATCLKLESQESVPMQADQ